MSERMNEFFGEAPPTRELRDRPIDHDRSAARRTQGQQPQPEPQKRSNLIVAAVLLAAVAAIVAAFTLGLNLMRGNDSVASQTVTTTQTVTQGVADQALVADNAACDGHTVKLLAHPGGNFGPTPLPQNAPEEAKQKILDIAKSEPTFLYGYYIFSPIYGKYPEVKGPADLVTKMDNGACFSAIGKRLYDDWSWYWKNADLTPRDSMPAAGTITGATQTGEVFQQSGKINDSYGYDVSYPGFGEKYDHGARGLCDQPFKEGVSVIPGAVQPPPEAPPLVETPVTVTSEQPCGLECIPVEQCPPGATLPYPECFPVEECPPGATLPYPICFPSTTTTSTTPPCPPGTVPPLCLFKDYGQGPATVVTPPQRPNPLPASPEMEEPVSPVVPSPTAPYTPPPPLTSVVVAPTITQTQAPRTTQAPAPEAPKASTVTTTNSAGTAVTTEQGSTTDLSGMG